MELTTFVCKTCGRAIKSESKPNFCYADRTPNLENISEEDTVKMGLFTNKAYFVIDSVIPEFASDYNYDPFSGEKRELGILENSLSDFQDIIMGDVRSE